VPQWFELPSGLRLAADAWGDPAAPPVLFLHGGGQTRHAWSGACEVVARAGWRAIALDHRGHGDSDRAPGGAYEDDDFRDDLLAVIDVLGVRPVLVGASLGGLAALLAEQARPGCSAGVVFVDVTPRLEQTGVERVLAFMRARPDGFASLEEAADAVAAYQPHRRRDGNLDGLRKNLRQGDDGRWRWHWDPRLLKTWSPERWDPERRVRTVARRLDAARGLTVPVLLVRGRMSDVVSEASAREFLEAVPHARYVDLAGAAHMVAGDRNDAFTGAVLDFLATLR
jgi:pimeloyl-ACP methyl ester carboxylesterase